MDTKNLDAIRKLSTMSETVGSFFVRYREMISDPSCDKHHAQFNRDDRFTGFKVNLYFSSCKGYYGNSSCSTILSLDQDLVEPYFIKAINQHREQIFATAAELMRADATSKADAAREELRRLQEMVEGIDRPEPPNNPDHPLEAAGAASAKAA